MVQGLAIVRKSVPCQSFELVLDSVDKAVVVGMAGVEMRQHVSVGSHHPQPAKPCTSN